MASDSVIQPFTRTDGGVTRVAGARLCHFRIGSADPLREHTQWINQYLIRKLLLHDNHWIDILGTSSASGNAQKNEALAGRRARAVRKAIAEGVSGPLVHIKQVRPETQAEAAADAPVAGSEDAYYRGVKIFWYGLGSLPDMPYTPPPPEDQGSVKIKKRKAPAGCWCITDIKSAAAPGPVKVTKGDLTLLNDKGEEWVVSGVGLGAEASTDAVSPSTVLDWAMKVVKQIQGHTDLLEKVGVEVKKDAAPGDTAGGVFRGFTWKSDLTVAEVVAGKHFTVVTGGLNFIVAGASAGLILFDIAPLGPIGAGYDLATGVPWGFFVGAALSTMQLGAGVGGTCYRITGYAKRE
jgi:hypothetical protein